MKVTYQAFAQKRKKWSKQNKINYNSVQLLKLSILLVQHKNNDTFLFETCILLAVLLLLSHKMSTHHSPYKEEI